MQIQSDAADVRQSLWQATAVPAPLLGPALAGGADCEVAVVGAGFAGLGTALALARRGVAVTVLEAGRVGDGASGRCGGHVLHGGRIGLAELSRQVGPAAGRRLHDFGQAAAAAAFALIREQGLRCDALQQGSLYVADTEAGLAEARAKFQALQAAGVPARWLQGDALAQTLGSSAYRGGYLNPLAGGVQPLSLARELARVAHAAGARVHEASPVLGLERRPAGWRLRTPQGWLDARRVLLATNGRWLPAGSPWPALHRSVVPVWSFQVASAALPAACGVLPGRQVVSDARRLLNYFRVDAGGHLVMGGKGRHGGPRDARSFDRQQRHVDRLYPALAGMAPAWRWGGEVSVTRGRRPRLFAYDDAGTVLASVACNGKGVAWNLALGPVLAEALCGTPAEALPLPPLEPAAPIPLHGLRPLYAAAATAWMQWLDRRDDRATPTGEPLP
jgi:glycine/D-amino acid oxidase-like deaminating enzyme